MPAPRPLAAAEPGAIEVQIEGLRNGKGLVHLCLTAQPRYFPDCRKDPSARTLSLPAASARVARFGPVPHGAYALALLHDENGNGRMDKFAIMPKEGFGFSNNPAIRFGPPKFTAARFSVGAGLTRQVVRMRYIL